MPKNNPRTIDLLEIDLESGKNWLALGKEMERDKIRERIYAKHRARYLEQVKEKTNALDR